MFWLTLSQGFTVFLRRHHASSIRKRQDGTHQKRLQTATVRLMEPHTRYDSYNWHANGSNLPTENLDSTAISGLLAILLGGLLVIFLFAAAAFGIFLIKLLSRKEEDTTQPKLYHAPLSMKISIAVLLIAFLFLGYSSHSN